MIRAALLLALLGSPAAAAERYLCWRGENGYTMSGRFTFPDALASAELITGSDVTEFQIEGFHDGRFLGKWSLTDMAPGTSWLLRYSPRAGQFPLFGDSGLYQMWNANGAVDDCGDPGFGFNAGNGGQDICVNGIFVNASTIAWDTPIRTYPRPQDPVSCSNAALTGKGQE